MPRRISFSTLTAHVIAPVVWLVCAPALAASAQVPLSASVAQARAVADSAAASRDQIAREEVAARKACYAKFSSSGCLKAAARNAQQQRAQLRKEEVAAKHVLREDRAAKQKERVRERALRAPPTPQPAQQRPPLSKTPGAAAAKSPEKKAPLQGNLTPQQVAANEAANAKRQQEAAAKKAEINKRAAERAAKKAKQAQPEAKP